MQPLCVSASGARRERDSVAHWSNEIRHARTDRRSAGHSSTKQTEQTQSFVLYTHPTHITQDLYIYKREKERERRASLILFLLLPSSYFSSWIYLFFKRSFPRLSFSRFLYKSVVSAGSYFFYYYFLPSPFCIFPSCL
jgi:hypothetical protein